MAKKGEKMTLEARKKLSLAKFGKPNLARLGKIASLKTRRKLIEKARIRLGRIKNE